MRVYLETTFEDLSGKAPVRDLVELLVTSLDEAIKLVEGESCGKFVDGTRLSLIKTAHEFAKYELENWDDGNYTL